MNTSKDVPDILSMLVKHDNLINTENTAGSSNLSSQVRTEFHWLGIVHDRPRQGYSHSVLSPWEYNSMYWQGLQARHQKHWSATLASKWMDFEEMEIPWEEICEQP